jgi:hypothetical protein
LAIVFTTGVNLKKNERKEKETLKVKDEPCVCGHVNETHLKSNTGNPVCIQCYGFGKYYAFHEFKLDNLALVEKLVNQKELEKYKKYES